MNILYNFWEYLYTHLFNPCIRAFEYLYGMLEGKIGTIPTIIVFVLAGLLILRAIDSFLDEFVYEYKLGGAVRKLLSYMFSAQKNIRGLIIFVVYIIVYILVPSLRVNITGVYLIYLLICELIYRHRVFAEFDKRHQSSKEEDSDTSDESGEEATHGTDYKWFGGMSTMEAKSEYRRLAKIYHPDNKRTGDIKVFMEIKDEYEKCYG